MQKLDFFKFLFNTNKILFKQQRLVQTSLNAFNDKNTKQPVKYEEYEEPFKNMDIKNLEDIGVLKKKWSWPKYNRIIYPPSKDGEPKVTPFVHHMRTYIQTNPQKLWFTASMVRNGQKRKSHETHFYQSPNGIDA
jgi:hypothetical protein